MTPSLWCSPDVYMAQVDTDIVVLDVNRDRYHCLIDAADVLLLGDGGAIFVTDDEVAVELMAAGLAMCSPPLTRRLEAIPPCGAVRPSLRAPRAEVFHAAAAWLIAIRIFRGKSLAALIDFHRPGRGRTCVGEDRLADLVAAARTARPWIPFEGECLQRSFQLRCFLAMRGVAADWVFGVRTWPFGAHCWLQVGDLVVGDRLERVRRYTPIMRA